jgi:hypothetical protein
MESIPEYLELVKQTKGVNTFLEESRSIHYDLKALLEKTKLWPGADLEKIKEQEKILDDKMQELEKEHSSKY